MRALVKPTPGKVRAKLPRLSLNPETGAPVSDWTIYNVMHKMCYDESEDDPWVYEYSPAKDYLSDTMMERRVIFADHVLDELPAGAWSTHVAIDPCISILPTTAAQTDDQKIAAMGVRKMMSKKSRFKGGELPCAPNREDAREPREEGPLDASLRTRQGLRVRVRPFRRCAGCDTTRSSE